MAERVGHSKWVCRYHVAFTPEFRRKINCGGMREDVREIIRDLLKKPLNKFPRMP